MTRRLPAMSGTRGERRLEYRRCRSPPWRIASAANRCRPLPTLVLILRSAVLIAICGNAQAARRADAGTYPSV